MEQSSDNNKCNEENSCQLNGEVVLQDMMDNVCQPLKINDLSHVAQVCKSWNEEAQREMDKRYLECKILPYLHSKELKKPNFHVSKLLDTKPHVTILFPGTSRDVDDIRDEVDLEFDTCVHYRKQLPNKVIVIGVFESMVNKDVIHSIPVEINEKPTEKYIPAGILGLFLPWTKKLNIHVSCILETDFFFSSSEKIQEMICSLGPYNGLKSTLIIFVANPDRVFDLRDPLLTSMLTMIKNKYFKTSYTLWGLVTSYKIFASLDSNKDSINGDKNEAKMIALNLTGPNLESWSTVINVYISKQELQQKLTDFKDRIRLKKCNLGFITCPVVINDPESDSLCYNNNRELINNVKSIFPEINFLGAFCEDEDFYFGVDSTSSDNKLFMSNEIISIMIMSYD